MAESLKGKSATAASKNSSSFGSAGDFGKDFLSSWKSTKKGNDEIDFDVESVPRNKKKAFNFDKLDDFELGGDFDKLSSFKMDMTDLDFSSPLKKTAKPKGKSCEDNVQGKKESKQDKFSFKFVFNELDKFDLDSNLLKGEEKTRNHSDDGGPDRSTKHVNDKESIMHDENQESIIHDKNQLSRVNSVIRADVFEDNETKRLPVSESTDILRSDHLIEPNNANCAGSSTSDYEHQDVSCEPTAPTEIKLIVAEENNKLMHNNDGNKQQTDGACFAKKYSDNAKPKFSLQSVSGDNSAQEALPQFGKGFASLDLAQANPVREVNDTARSIDSSQSRNSSPANSYSSRCWRRKNITESPNTTGESKKLQGNKNEVAGGSTVPSESTECHNDVDDGCATNFSQKNACPSMYNGDKQNSCPKLLPSPLHRRSFFGESMSVKEKAATALQLNPLTKSTENEPQPTSAQTPKQLCAMTNGKVKTVDVFPDNVNRESKQNLETEVENHQSCILKSRDKSLSKGIDVVKGSGENDHCDTSHLRLPPSNLLGQITASSTANDILPNLFSGTATKKGPQKISIEGQGISLKDGKVCDITSFKVSRVPKSNVNTSSSTIKRETKSVRFSETKLEFSLNAASKISRSATTKKYALSSPSLKRKIVEESNADSESLNPFKRVMESTTERRKSLVASPTIDKKVVLGTGNPEEYQGNVATDNLTYSNCSPEMRSMTEFILPVLIENDGNVEKAEACAKELDDICNMLRKKHEEAKEVLVRVIVNNNALLMLNHPMYDEKIRSLQRFASSLQSREF